MLANIITFSRLLLTFVVVAVLGNRHPTLDITLIGIIVIIFALDAVDGIVARKRNETSETGALLDTIADRIVENTFWIYFSANGLILVWMPIAVMTRGILTDTLQRTHGYPKNGWTYTLTHSRISRGLYGGLKMFTFISLASATVFQSPFLEQGSLILATLTVSVCLLRGIPFFFFFIRKPSCPRST
ncbi:CDP-alcohol phosphatidyltransferase family protein [Candidatus Poribacteria bacterium]|nr:CDP-alcohol phosphatidyltransferase family protein [Candidatus Poribacteria bacterium]